MFYPFEVLVVPVSTKEPAPVSRYVHFVLAHSDVS